MFYLILIWLLYYTYYIPILYIIILILKNSVSNYVYNWHGEEEKEKIIFLTSPALIIGVLSNCALT